jgi:D-3-phosphoglycerate dehydrogenase / 2-oxoglutarate reductase
VEIVTVPVRERLTEAELLPVVPTLHGAICGDDQFTARVLREATRLKVIAKWGTGIDSIDVGAAAQLGIRVCNTPGAFTDPVADSVLGYVLSFARRLPWMDRDVRRGEWRKPGGTSLRECTLGVVGVGEIGRAVVRRAIAFGMRVVGTDPRPVPADFLAETGLAMTSLEALLAEADFISLNCDLNPTSFHIIDAAALARIKPGAYLVNTARGPLVDETALVAALAEGRIAGAALDVFEVEPLPAAHPLRAFESCLLAPHNANASPAAWARVHERTIASLLDGLRAGT